MLPDGVRLPSTRKGFRVEGLHVLRAETTNRDKLYH